MTVFDNGLQRGCGCEESAGALFTNGQIFQCTLAAGTKLIVSYSGITIAHQLVFGSTSISLGPHQPGNTNRDTVVLSSTNPSLTFSDIGSGVSGVFIVE